MLILRFSKTSAKFLKNCDNQIYHRIIKKINELQTNPFPQDSKRIEGRTDKTFRIRVGDYRIIYLIIKETNTLIIADINKRQRIY